MSTAEPIWRKQRRERHEQWRTKRWVHADKFEPRPTKEELAARLGEVPDEDRRSLTSRICGDPDPGDPRRAP